MPPARYPAPIQPSSVHCSLQLPHLPPASHQPCERATDWQRRGWPRLNGKAIAPRDDGQLIHSAVAPSHKRSPSHLRPPLLPEPIRLVYACRHLGSLLAPPALTPTPFPPCQSRQGARPICRVMWRRGCSALDLLGWGWAGVLGARAGRGKGGVR